MQIPHRVFWRREGEVLTGMREVSVSEFAKAHAAGAAVIDVGEVEEYNRGHIPGAVSLPVQDMSRNLTAALCQIQRDAPVYVVCAAGNRSLIATGTLMHAGYDAYSVYGGTTGWIRAGHPVVGVTVSVTDSTTTDSTGLEVTAPPRTQPTGNGATTPVAAPAATILAIETPTLGDRSYLVHDGRVALVIDPQRDIDRVLDLARITGVRITHIFETHIHNDYVTGGLALARETGAAYHVNADDPVTYQRTGVRDGDVIDVSEALRVRVLATPGHTYTHLSFVLEEHGTATAVFSGGSLLFGSTGRPDLLGPGHTHDLVHHQYASAQRLAAALPDQTRVMPTHGFGSFCSSTQSAATASTIGVEKTTNPVLTQDEERYVTELLAGLDAFPAYYAHMGPANTAGPAGPDLSPPESADAQQLRRRLEQGEWLVDLRTRTAFAAGHAPGTLNFGLDGSFATYLGWLIPWGTPVTLLGETAEQVAQAQREMVRIGIDRPAAAATGGPDQWTDGPLRTVERATFADLAHVRHHRRVVILDVRRHLESAESHIDGAVHIPLHELLARAGEVPSGELWVHCAAGYRASIATSILLARGHRVIAVDDDYTNAAAAGLPITSEADHEGKGR